MTTRLRLLVILSAFVLDLLTTTPLLAIEEGSLSDGYTYRGGYWWLGNTAYRRTLYEQPGYSSCGYYYPSRQFYKYFEDHSYTAPAASVNYKEADWRSKLLEIAKSRDEYESKLRAGVLEQAYFQQSIQTLGLQNSLAPYAPGLTPSYGTGTGYSGSLQLSSAGLNGTTQYGYSYNSVASMYGDLNLNTLYQQASRLAENAQSLAGDATTQFGTLVGTAGSNQARVAEILARSQAVKDYLQNLQQPGTTLTEKRFTFKVEPGANGQMQVTKVPDPSGDVQAVWVQSAQRCVACHSGQVKKGGFDVSTYPAMSQEQRQVVIGRLVTSDTSKSMPRMPNSYESPGPRLPLEEVKAWLLLPAANTTASQQPGAGMGPAVP